MVKDIRILLNVPPQGIFFSGSDLSGELVVQLDEPKTYKQIEVALIGQAYVHWTEHHGPTGDQTYTSSERFFNLRTIFEMEEEIPTCTLPAGIHKFPFQFHLPVDLPSSFRRSVGRIRYYVQGKIIYHAEPKCDEGSCKVKVPITVVEVIDVNSSDLQAPLQKEKQKAICSIMCASAPMTLQVELPRSGYCLEEKIPLKVILQNTSRQHLKLRASLIQDVVYTAQGYHQYSQVEVTSVTSDRLQPRSTSTWNPEKFIVPAQIETTLRSCGIISIEYVVRITVVVQWGLNFSVDVAVTVGNVPLHSPKHVPTLASPPKVHVPSSQLPLLESYELFESQCNLALSCSP